MASLHIHSLPIDGTEVHVQEVCRAVNLKRSRGYAVLGEVGLDVIAIACRCHHEESVTLPHLVLNVGNEATQRRVERHIHTLHLHLPVADILLGGGKGDGKKVGNLVLAHDGVADHTTRDISHSIIVIIAI